MAGYPNRSKSSYYGKKLNYNESRFKFQPGVRGFLCTCSYGEKDCKKEAINLLREYSEEKDVSFVLSNQERSYIIPLYY